MSILLGTQTEGRFVRVNLSQKGNQFSVQEPSGTLFPVASMWVEGIPKGFVPQPFFKHCNVRCVPLETGKFKLYFGFPIHGGMLAARSPATTEELFVLSLGNLGALSAEGLEKGEQLRLCKETRSTILELAARAERGVEPLNQRSRELEGDFERLHREYGEYAGKQREVEGELKELEGKIVAFSSREADLNREIERIDGELNAVKKKIRKKEEEKKRIGVASALAGGVGVRMILDAIGRLTGDRDNLQKMVDQSREERRGLVVEKKGVERELEQKKGKARDLEGEIGRLKERISVRDRQIKECGANLTKVRNVALELRGMVEKYRFLGQRVEEIRVAADLEILDVNDVVGARRGLEAIQQSEAAQRYLLNT